MKPYFGKLSSPSLYGGSNKILVGNGLILLVHTWDSLCTYSCQLKFNTVFRIPRPSHYLLSLRKLCHDNIILLIFNAMVLL